MGNKDHRTGSARLDWNLRAQEDYRHAIWSPVRSEDGESEFRAFGEGDAATVLSLLAGEDPSQWRALEYGCGAGRIMEPLAKSLAEVHGIDISDEMVRIARQRLGVIPGLHLHVLEEERLPFPDAALDLVYSAHVFQHMSKPAFRMILPEIARVLRPGGRFVFQLTHPYTLRRWLRAASGSHRDGADTYRRRYYTAGQIRRALRRCGLDVRRTERRGRHAWYAAERLD